MQVEIHNSGDRILTDWDDYSETNFKELAKEALSLGLLELEYHYRFGWGLEFIVLHPNGRVTGHRYHFANWKAWDDLFEIPSPNVGLPESET